MRPSVPTKTMMDDLDAFRVELRHLAGGAASVIVSAVNRAAAKYRNSKRKFPAALVACEFPKTIWRSHRTFKRMFSKGGVGRSSR